MNYFEKINKKQEELLQNIKNNLCSLEELLNKYSDDWNYEDMIYRFYHQSYKCYYIQNCTLKIVELLKSIAPSEVVFNCFFEEIFSKGTGKKFHSDHNVNWTENTRPMIEAFFHAKFFLSMAVKFGKQLEKVPEVLPSGWAALLYFYNLR